MKQFNGIFATALVAAGLLALLLAGCANTQEDLTTPALSYSGSTAGTETRSRYLAGTCEAGTEVTVTLDTAATVSDLVVKDGRWSCRVDGLADGANAVAVKAVKSGGNQTTLNFSLLYDALSIETYVSPLAGSTTVIGGQVDPAAAGSLAVEVDTGALVQGLSIDGNRWSADLAGLVAGNNLVTVSIEHPELGRVEKTLTLNVNPSAPLVTIGAVSSPTGIASQELAGSRGSDLEVTVAAPTATLGTVNLAGAPDAWSAGLESLHLGKNPVTASVTANGITVVAHSMILYDPQRLVVEQSPAEGAVEVDPATTVQAVFVEPMNPATVGPASFLLEGPAGPVAASVSYDAELRLATLTPGTLSAGATYTATLTTAVATATGQALAEDVSWTFTVR